MNNQNIFFKFALFNFLIIYIMYNINYGNSYCKIKNKPNHFTQFVQLSIKHYFCGSIKNI